MFCQDNTAYNNLILHIFLCEILFKYQCSIQKLYRKAKTSAFICHHHSTIIWMFWTTYFMLMLIQLCISFYCNLCINIYIFGQIVFLVQAHLQIQTFCFSTPALSHHLSKKFCKILRGLLSKIWPLFEWKVCKGHFFSSLCCCLNSHSLSVKARQCYNKGV